MLLLKFILLLFMIITFINFESVFCKTYKKLRKTARVVIIGAGAAGIATAAKLFENGFEKLTIFEAKNRTGGRIFTSQLGNYTIDLGAQWVHGEEGNAVFNIAYPMGLIDNSRVDLDHRKISSINMTDFMDSRGNTLDSSLLSKIFFSGEDGKPKNITAFKSFGEYQEKKFIKMFKKQPSILKEKKKFLHLLELQSFSDIPSSSWLEEATSVFNEHLDYPGNQEVNWKDRGYSTILDVLMKRFPDSKKELPIIKNTLFNTEVESIEYGNSTKDVNPVIITTSKGHIYTADHVIVTVSLGVLKEKHQSLFVPSLPQYKVSAIKNFGFGCVAKIYLLFEKPFWKNNQTSEGKMIYFLWNNADKRNIKADPERNWLLGMYGAMTVAYKPNILLLWVTGKYANQLEMVSDNDVFKYSFENIQRFLGKKFNVTKPLSMSRSRWCSDPHFKGTYSYKSVAADEQKVHTEMLERPLGNSVLFAGEATSQNRYSTVDGAIVSGWKAGAKLISLYKN